MNNDAAEQTLRDLFHVAVNIADPMTRVAAALPNKPTGRVVVIGAGKASARMAEAVEAAWGKCEGLVITRYGYARPCAYIKIVEAAHPIPDQAGADATKQIMALVSSLGPDDFVLALISGGGSALLSLPAGNISFAEKQKINHDLLASGAPIDQMNMVRKHLSQVKGGQLAAAAYPARMLSLMISDVAGDNPADIASGPTVGDLSTSNYALAILNRLNIALPQSVLDVLQSKTAVLSPNDPLLSKVENLIIAAPAQSLNAAARMAEKKGFKVKMLGDAIEGEARDLGYDQAVSAMEIQSKMKFGDAPIILLSGGECTVTRKGDGIGGPNAEFALSAALSLDGATGIYAIACDTDGVDGAAEVAGAFIGPKTLAKAQYIGVDAKRCLMENDSHSFFKAIDDQVITGPTLTNVNDFRCFLILPKDGVPRA